MDDQLHNDYFFYRFFIFQYEDELYLKNQCLYLDSVQLHLL